ncbi:MAG: glycosyltransferase [Chloroflexi bacterium]|nr:glycosyltransferase [Chloroflexota bacterium]
MRVVILTVGSRGDVQPYVALGVGLQRAGYQVTLATDPSFESFVRDYGLHFAPIRASFLQLIQSAEGRAALAGKNRLRLMQKVMPMLGQIMDDAWAAAQAADIIVYHPKLLAGYHIAEKLDVPGLLALALPAYSPTGAFANPALGGGNYGSFLNKLSYDLFLKVALLPYRRMINRWRKERLGLAPFTDERMQRGQPVPKLYAYSEHVVPSPADWDAATFVTGYWFLEREEEWQPPADLGAFLEKGAPPVYVGFGSMAGQDAPRTTQIVINAVQATGQRAILASGYGGLRPAALADTMYTIDAVPHAWLFPHCAAVVHHGGAGTTAAGLRAGKPTVICPFFGDQPFWGKRVLALGVGPQPIPQKKLTVAGLAQAIHVAVTDTPMQARATALGEKIRAENGVANAVDIIRKLRCGMYGAGIGEQAVLDD